MKKAKKQIRNTVALGVGSMAGSYALGVMGNLPGMPSNNVTGIANASLGLANVGGLANIGMNVMPRSKKRRSKKK